jgi:hypothetical protein
MGIKIMKIFVCFTPLHVLIVKRIIEIENIDEFVFIYFTDADNRKNRFYYESLSNKAIESNYIVLKKKFRKDIFSILKLSKQLSDYKNLIYYTGKIKSSKSVA